MADSSGSRHLFGEGDHALLIDRRGRRYLVKLRSSGSFESHIGMEEGSWVTTARGHRLLALRPTMAD